MVFNLISVGLDGQNTVKGVSNDFQPDSSDLLGQRNATTQRKQEL